MMRSCRLVAALVAVLVLLPLLSACGDRRLSYAFVDLDQRDYRLSMVVAERGPSGQIMGTVTLDARLRLNVNIDRLRPCGNYVTVDYEDAVITTTGSAQDSGNRIPRAYFNLCEKGFLAFNSPTGRGDAYNIELAKTGHGGSLSVMLLNTFVAKCFAQPQRDCRHQLKAGNEWTTLRHYPGEFLTYLFTGRRPTGQQNRELTRVKVMGLTKEGALAELAWSSVTPLQGFREVDLSKDLWNSGLDPSEIALLMTVRPDTKVTLSVSGSTDCSGTAVVQADGWPQRARVDRMTVDVVYSWSYPNDPESASQSEQMVLDITGSVEAES